MRKEIIQCISNTQRDGYNSCISSAAIFIGGEQYWIAGDGNIPQEAITTFGLVVTGNAIPFCKSSPLIKGMGVYMSRPTEFLIAQSTMYGSAFAAYGSRFDVGDMSTRGDVGETIFPDGKVSKGGDFNYSEYLAATNPTGYFNHSTLTEDGHLAIYSDGELRVKSQEVSTFAMPDDSVINIIDTRGVPFGFIGFDNGKMTKVQKLQYAQNIKSTIIALGGEVLPPILVGNLFL